MLERQIELLEKVIELQRLTAPVITVTPVVTRDIYPSYPLYPIRYGTGDPIPSWPTITCQG